MSRRHIVTAWNPATIDEMALPACHAMFQFYCRPLVYMERLRLWNDNMLTMQIGHPSEKDLDVNKIPKYELSCKLYQRSADLFLGIPFNIASYALLTFIIAKITNMKVGRFIHSFGDVHIYNNHVEQVKLQLERERFKLPSLHIDNHGMFSFRSFMRKDIDFDTLINVLRPDMFQLYNYKHHEKIEGELSTGMKK